MTFVKTLIASSMALYGWSAAAATAYVQADTTVVQSSPAESRHGWTFLTAGPGTQGLLTFALADVLPSGTTAAEIKNARLVLDIPTIQGAGSLQVNLLQGTFTEATAPGWSTRPPATTGIDASVVFPLKQALSYHYVDVTPLVKKALNLGLKEFTVSIAPAASTPGATALIWARENALISPAWTPSLASRLNIDVASTNTAAPTFIWATANNRSSCSSFCPAGTVPAANSAGEVCKDETNGAHRNSQYGRYNADPLRSEGWLCGGRQWLSQCSCLVR